MQAPVPTSNPFSTCRVAPGKLAWLADAGDDVASLAARFQGLRARAAIVGPHGSGKSTLLAHLVPQLGTLALRRGFDASVSSQNAAGQIIWLGLRRQSGQLDTQPNLWKAGRILVLDGFEQLRPLSRLRVRFTTRLCKMGLLVTCHRSLGLRVLFTTKITQARIVALVEHALDQSQADPRTRERLCDPQRLQTLLRQHNGNAREVMMQVYDDYESLVRGDSKPSHQSR